MSQRNRDDVVVGAKDFSPHSPTPAEALPEGFKMTELGPLPAEWQVVRLGEIFTPVSKKTRETLIKDDAVYRLLTVRLYAKGITLRSEEKGNRIKTKKLYGTKQGDFVFSKIDARNGAWGFVPADLEGGLVSGDFPILILDRSKADQLFIETQLRQSNIWESLRNIAVGTTNRRRLQPIQFLDVRVVLPPLPEQRAIAHVLRTVQEAQEATERVITALKELKKSLMRHLFSYGPVPLDRTDQVELQETELGPLPAHWQVVRLGEVAEVRAGIAFPSQHQGLKVGKFPFYKVSDMNHPENKVYMKIASNWIDDNVFNLLRAKVFPRGTIIFPKVGGALLTNKKRILTTESLVDNNIMGVTIRDEMICLPIFCFYWYESVDIRQFSNPGPLPSINAQAVINSFIPLPPLPEQQEIARILQAVDAKIAAEEQRKEVLERLFKSLLAELMSGRVRLPPAFVRRFVEEKS